MLDVACNVLSARGILIALKLKIRLAYPVVEYLNGVSSIFFLLNTNLDSSVVVRPYKFSDTIAGTNPAYLGIQDFLFGRGVYTLAKTYSKTHIIVASTIMIGVSPFAKIIFTNSLSQVRKLCQRIF